MKAVLFDFDYTLGDSTEGIIACLSYGLEKLGFPASGREEMRKTIGLSLGPSLYRLTGCDDEATAREFTRLFMEKADEVMVDAARFLPGAVELLRDLRSAGVKTAIVTTKAAYRIRAILQKQGIPELVDVVVGSDRVTQEKPHPEPALLALRELGAAAGEALYVGDSVVDARCAQAAGIAFVGVLNGTTTREELEAYPHLTVTRDLIDLDGFLFKEWDRLCPEAAIS